MSHRSKFLWRRAHSTFEYLPSILKRFETKSFESRQMHKEYHLHFGNKTAWWCGISLAPLYPKPKVGLTLLTTFRSRKFWYCNRPATWFSCHRFLQFSCKNPHRWYFPVIQATSRFWTSERCRSSQRLHRQLKRFWINSRNQNHSGPFCKMFDWLETVNKFDPTLTFDPKRKKINMICLIWSTELAKPWVWTLKVEVIHPDESTVVKKYHIQVHLSACLSNTFYHQLAFI